MKLFVVEGGMGRLIAQAATASQASASARRKYGTVNAPFTARVATKDEMCRPSFSALVDHA